MFWYFCKIFVPRSEGPPLTSLWPPISISLICRYVHQFDYYKKKTTNWMVVYENTLSNLFNVMVIVVSSPLQIFLNKN